MRFSSALLRASRCLFRSIFSRQKSLARPLALQYTPELSKVSGQWLVLADNTEIPAILLSPAVLSVLRVSNSLLRLIHVSDHMPPPSDNRAHLSDCSIRIRAKLPAVGRILRI